MKTRATILIASLLLSFLFSRARDIDSLKMALASSKEDTNKVNIYYFLSYAYQWSYPDTSLKYSIQGLDLARKLHFKKGEIRNLLVLGEALAVKGNYAKSLEMLLKALELAELSNDPQQKVAAFYGLGSLYLNSGDYQSALKYYLKATAFQDRYEHPLVAFIGETYYYLNLLDSSLHYINKAYEIMQRTEKFWVIPYYYLGGIYNKKDDPARALDYYRQGLRIANGPLGIAEGHMGLATVFKKLGKTDSAIYYAKNVLNDSFASFPTKQMAACGLLTEIYKPVNIDSAFKYLEIELAATDSLFSKEKIKQMQNLSFNEQMRQQEILAQQEQYKTKLKMYALFAAVVVFLGIAIILWRNSKIKQRAFALLQKQKEETDHHRSKAETAFEDLKVTQKQLIQSEKMASLGELTAGIAHEIQNPLNFVNKFSEVNTELIKELKDEINAGNKEEAILMADDIEENELKITHHGKRADAIVKGMLQHSRTNTGKKEPTDINALGDEYLRLSYHGLRAKDKSFNADFKTNFDENIGKIHVIPQDLGRVLLNLYNNAFYSVNEKKKQLDGNFKPVVSVSTKRSADKVAICVRDNGTGISKQVLDKIYQPFFTTKPTGQGTGLGLSMSYDIIKAHGGELKVETKEGEGAEFIVVLPIK